MTGLSVLMVSDSTSVLAAAVMEVAGTGKIRGIEVDKSLVMAYHTENLGSDEYRVSNLCPAFADKFDVHIDLDK